MREGVTLPHRAVSQWCGRPCRAGTWQWKEWETTGKHTYGPPGSSHKNGCAGPVAAPKSQRGRFSGQNVQEALFPATTAIYDKLLMNTFHFTEAIHELHNYNEVMRGGRD